MKKIAVAILRVNTCKQEVEDASKLVLERNQATVNAKVKQMLEIRQNHKIKADQGDIQSQYEVAKLYYEGIGETSDKKEAIKYYKLAADKGHLASQNELSMIYFKDDNDSEGIKYLKMAADQGDEESITALGETYEEMGNQEEAFKYYKLAADKHDDNGFWADCIGKMYEEGRGVRRSIPDALTYYKLSVDRGNVRAAYDVGRMHDFNGITSSTKCLTSAFKYYKLAADIGHRDAQYKVGVFLRKHIMPEANHYSPEIRGDNTEAFKYFGKAAAQGHPDAQNAYGEMYSYVTALSREERRERSLKWYKMAATQGHAKAQENIIRLSY